MTDIETDEPAIRRFIRIRGLSGLAGSIGTSPIGTIENGRARLQKGKIVSANGENAEAEQLERRLPGMLRGRGAHATGDDLGPEAAGAVPPPRSGGDTVGTVDQLQARL